MRGSAEQSNGGVKDPWCAQPSGRVPGCGSWRVGGETGGVGAELLHGPPGLGFLCMAADPEA